MINCSPGEFSCNGSFIGAFKELKPQNWCLTEDYLQYTQQEDTKWVPDADYYMRLISRLVDSIHFGSQLFADTSLFKWRLKVGDRHSFVRSTGNLVNK